LKGHPLVITIDSLFTVDGERTSTRTLRAHADLDFLITGFSTSTHHCILIEGTKNCVTLSAVKFDVFELRKHSGTAGNDTADANKGIKIVPSKRAKGGKVGEVRDAHMNFRMDALVRRIKEQNAS
jgi:hypothetical protein